MKRFSSLLSGVFFLPLLIAAQPPLHVQMMRNPNANFYETQKAFEQYWANRPIVKHSGWKPFKRWEYYMQNHLGTDSLQSAPQNNLAEMERYVAAHPEFLSGTQKRNSTSGNWTARGPYPKPYNDSGQPNGNGRINCVAFNPSAANDIFIGSPSGGIWKSTDYGTSWSDISNSLTRLGVSSIVVHPTGPDTIYIGTGDRDAGDAPGYGVWRSTNGGASFSPRNTTMGNVTVSKIVMDPSNSQILIAAANNEIYRTTNGGASWTQVFTGHWCNELLFKPGDPTTLYAAGSNFYRSTNNGVSWTQITSGVPTGSSRFALAVSANQPTWVYILSGTGSGLQGLYRSTDSGLNFSSQSTTPNILGYSSTGSDASSQAWYDLALAADPANGSIIYAGGVNIWKSTDAGVTWAIKAHWTGSGAAAVHADQHYLYYNPGNASHLFACNDGGIYYTSNGGTNWTELSSGLNISQVYKIGVSANRADLAINGLQDNGTCFNRTSNWYTPLGGDGMESAVDYTDDRVMYGELYYGEIYRCDDGGVMFNTVAGNPFGGMNEDGGWVTPYKLHPSNPNIMFVGKKNVWRSTNVKAIPATGVTWTAISSFSGSNNIIDLEFSRSFPDTVYVSRSGTGKFYRSANALGVSPSWTDLTASLPAGGTVTDIEVSSTNAALIWIAMGTEIYQSTNAGTSWTNFSGTLPNININTIVADRLSPVGAMYLGMDVGVYYRDNTLADWVAFNSGLPNVEITELEIYYDPECRDKDLLVAGTYGRGMWQSDMRNPGTIAPDACFTAEPATTVCVGLPVGLKDQSAYQPTSWNWVISPGTYTFTNSTTAASQNPVVQFSSAGNYTITLTATNANGSDPVTRTNYITVTGTSSTPPVSQNFETMTACGTSGDCQVTTCVLSSGWENEANITKDDIEWRVDANGTPTGSSGPSIDFNPGTTTGKYVYTDARICYGKVAHLLSPCINLSSYVTAQVSFARHMYGVDMGVLHLDIFYNGQWINDIMTPISGDQGNSWQNSTVSLTAYVGSIVRLRWRGITGNGDRGDMALDAINITGTTGLPVSDYNFRADLISAGNIRLSWNKGETCREDHFILAQEIAPGVFKDMGTFTGGKVSAYYGYDNAPKPGLNVYRLMMHRADGTSELAGWAEIMNEIGGIALSCWPNPATDILNFDIQSADAKTVQMEIISIDGKRVDQRNLDLVSGMNHFQTQMDGLNNGIYILRIAGHSMKVVKN